MNANPPKKPNSANLLATPVTRFAPSPTGLLHAGNYRTALFNYLFSKHHQGKFLLRIEDTDRARSEARFEEDIRENLTWLGLEAEESTRQSERLPAHQAYLKKLLDEDLAYLSQEEATGQEKEGAREGEPRRKEVIRFRNPGKKVSFSDLVRGEVTFDTEELGDFVIAKSISEPLFHLAVVVDDHDMEVTHVIRGEDHLSNTPRQILIQEALGFARPIYAHIPLILAPDRSKLSKRSGARSVREYREAGILPVALLNHLALLGWNPGTEQEIFSPEELIEAFDLSRVQKGGAIFNEEKLKSINRAHLLALSKEEQVRLTGEYLKKARSLTTHQDPGWIDGEAAELLQPLIFERIETLSEITEQAERGEYDWFFLRPDPATDTLTWKDQPATEASRHLSRLAEILTSIDNSGFNKSTIKEAIWPYAEEEGRGDVLWPLRVALSGREKSADPFTLAEILGKEETLTRVEAARAKLDK